MDGPVKLMVYPYNPINEVLLKNRDLFDDYRIEVVASYKEDEAALAYCASKYEVKADSLIRKCSNLLMQYCWLTWWSNAQLKVIILLPHKHWSAEKRFCARRIPRTF